MSIFWNNLNKLCKERGIYPNTVANALNLSAATASKWKAGATPRDVTLQKIADYFGVTVEELTRENAPDAKVAFHGTEKLTPKQIKMVQSLIDQITAEEDEETV